jgi:hypothetical protein
VCTFHTASGPRYQIAFSLFAAIFINLTVTNISRIVLP